MATIDKKPAVPTTKPPPLSKILPHKKDYYLKFGKYFFGDFNSFGDIYINDDSNISTTIKSIAQSESQTQYIPLKSSKKYQYPLSQTLSNNNCKILAMIYVTILSDSRNMDKHNLLKKNKIHTNKHKETITSSSDSEISSKLGI